MSKKNNERRPTAIIHPANSPTITAEDLVNIIQRAFSPDDVLEIHDGSISRVSSIEESIGGHQCCGKCNHNEDNYVNPYDGVCNRMDEIYRDIIRGTDADDMVNSSTEHLYNAMMNIHNNNSNVRAHINNVMCDAINHCTNVLLDHMSLCIANAVQGGITDSVEMCRIINKKK